MESIARRARNAAGRIANARSSWFWPGFLAGCLYFGSVFLWIWSLYPLKSIGIENRALAILAISVGYLGSVGVMALWWGIASWCAARFLRSKPRQIFFPFVMASVFVLAEYARSWAFGILWWGSGSVIGPHWTFGNIAYWFASIPAIRAGAAVWGIYGIEFLLGVTVSALVFGVAQRKRGYRKWLVLALGGIAVLIAPWLCRQANSESFSRAWIPIVIIQTQKPSGAETSAAFEDFKQKLRLMDAAGKALGNQGGIVLLPEGAQLSRMLSTFLDLPSVRNYFRKLALAEVTVVDNNKIGELDGMESRTLAISSTDGIVGSYGKRILTPWGEFVPHVARWPLAVARVLFRRLPDPSRALSAGNDSHSVLVQGKTAKIAVCSDIISPSFIREGAGNYILGLNSIGIFSGNSQIEVQLLAMARFRAVENRKDLAWASNGGRSYIIDSQGNIRNIAQKSGYEILTGSVVPNTETTWYTGVGDWPILAIALAVLALTEKRIRHES